MSLAKGQLERRCPVLVGERGDRRGRTELERLKNMSLTGHGERLRAQQRGRCPGVESQGDCNPRTSLSEKQAVAREEEWRKGKVILQTAYSSVISAMLSRENTAYFLVLNLFQQQTISFNFPPCILCPSTFLWSVIQQFSLSISPLK